jgi:hypothetical protein
MMLRRSLLAGLLLPAPALGQGQGQGRGQGQGQGPGQGPGGPQRSGEAAALLAFTAAEQVRITAWLAANAASLQPLPPGIARNLARGKPLPPGIARRAAPQTLLTQLVTRPGYEVLVIGTSVVLAKVGSSLVQDMVQAARR